MEKVALIMAGGIGSRLWPISTQTKSKQFINLYNNETLIQNTIKRISKVFPPENIYVVGNINQKEELYKNLKNINKKNILLEPNQKKTACAIFYGITQIYKKHKDCIVGIFPSDHYIGDVNNFVKSLNQIIETTNDKITILGVKPEKANPKFGYLVPNNKNKEELLSFIEKPSIHIAKKLIRKNASWSIGIYLGNIKTYIELYKKYLNDIYTTFNTKKNINEIYNHIEGISFEKEIIEKHPENFKIYTCEPKWMDVGSFEGLDKIIPKGKNKNNIDDKNTFLNSSNCTLISTSNKKIYAIGVNDLMVIEGDDSILIVKKNMYNHIEKIKNNQNKK